MNIRVVSGTWTLESDGSKKGLVDASLCARAVQGAETDEDCTFQAKITITNGKAGVIANYTVDENWNEKYIQFVLDPDNNAVSIEAVQRDENGVEMLNTTLAWREKTLSEDSYITKIVTKTLSDGTKAVYCYLNGFLVCEAEDLAEGYDVGMQGIVVEGSEGDYATFISMFQQKPEYYVNVDDALSAIRAVPYKDLIGKGTEQDYYDYVRRLIENVSRFFDSQTERNEGFFKKGGIAVTDYFDGQGSEPADLEFAESITQWQTKAASFLLKQRPALSVTSIHENEAMISETDNWVEITKYRLRESREVIIPSTSIPTEGVQNVRIIYTAGYANTPIDVKNSCLQLIENYVKRFIADKSATMIAFARPQAVNFASPDVLTPDIRAIIDKYKLGSWGEM